jgi:hypothetical protein
MELKAGQIFFWNGGNEGILGKAITYFNMKTFGRSDCTHCGIISYVGDYAIEIYEAGNKGFFPREVSKEWFLQPQVSLGECKESLKDVHKNCLKYENTRYGWFDLFLIAVKHYTGISLSLTGEKRLICSEAVCRVLYDCSRSIDFQKEYKIPFDLITPEHIFLSKQVRIIK